MEENSPDRHCFWLEMHTMAHDQEDQPDDTDESVQGLGGPPEPPDDWRTWGAAEWRAYYSAELVRECARSDAWEAQRIALARERDPPSDPGTRR